MEPAATSGSVAPVFNDLDLEVVAYDGSNNETVFYPNNLATKDYDNTVEMIAISDVGSYLWFNVSHSSLLLVFSIRCNRVVFCHRSVTCCISPCYRGYPVFRTRVPLRCGYIDPLVGIENIRSHESQHTAPLHVQIESINTTNTTKLVQSKFM